MKKYITLLLATILLITMIPSPAFAEWFSNFQANDELITNAIHPRGSGVPMKAIVIIPGILGSTLKYGSTTVWPGGSGDTYLALNDNGTSVYTITSANDYGAANTYKALYDEIKENFYYSGYDIIFFDYDWRLDNTYTASLLTSELSSYSEVVLVAHSMGGLVAAKFLAQSSSNRSKTVALITMGTPYAGSATTFRAMQTGELISLGVLGYLRPALVKSVAQDSFAAYQLFPTSAYYSLTGFCPVILDGVSIQSSYAVVDDMPWAKTSSGSVKTQLSTASTFHSSLGSLSYHIIKTCGVPVYTIGGSGIDTISHVIMDSNHNITEYVPSPLGDGTVMLRSAGNGIPNKTVNVSHMGLVSDSEVLGSVVGVISQYTGVAVASASTQTMTSETDEVEYNNRGWIVGMNNKRIIVITDGINSLIIDDKQATIVGDKVYDGDGNYIGSAWGLDNSGRIQLVLFDGMYTLSCTGHTKLKFIDGGYVDRLVEYNFEGDDAEVSISGYLGEIVCEMDNVVVVPVREYSEQELASLNLE